MCQSESPERVCEETAGLFGGHRNFGSAFRAKTLRVLIRISSGGRGGSSQNDCSACSGVLRRFKPGVPVMEAAQPGAGKHDRVR